MDIVIRPASEEDLAWANERYAEIDFVPSTTADQVVVAWLGQERAGVGRIVPTGTGTGELGGMYVAPHARGRGVADGIVRHLLATTRTDTLFCIPFSDLYGIYERCGFRRIGAADDLPDPVANKLAYCRDHYDRPVTLLRWDRG